MVVMACMWQVVRGKFNLVCMTEEVNMKLEQYLLIFLSVCWILVGCDGGSEVGSSPDMTFDLELGKMANYGATPWYTEEISAGTSQLRFALDSGANFIWATSDQCTTTACNAHNKVNTSQPGFVWVDETTVKHSFGPWGSMYTRTGKVDFKTPVGCKNLT